MPIPDSANRRIGIILALTLMAAGCWLGVQLSLRKPLWNDEIYTQFDSIERHSYADILRGGLAEGNNGPLFYLMQKAIVESSGYRLTGLWQGEWNVSDWHGQVILRLNSIALMAFSLTLLFYFFWKEYSWLAGTYALLTGLSSYMVWAYWAEARPYALWFFLTTAQLLIFLKFLRTGGRLPVWGGALAAVHWLLSMTVVFGVVQAGIVCILLWWGKERNLRPYLGLLLLPALTGAFYFFRAPHMAFRLVAPVGDLVFPNIAPEWLLVMGGYAAWLLWKFSIGKGETEPPFRESRYFAVVALLLLFTAAVLVMWKWTSAPGMQGFEISERYFIYLNPAGVIAMPVMAVHLWRVCADSRWMRLNLILLFGGLLIWRMICTLSALADSGMYLL